MEQVSEYQQQAIDFLTATGAKLSFTYDGFKKYFQDDKQPRNVFSWEITRGDKTIKGKFGSSIADSCKPTPILESYEPVEIYAGIHYGVIDKIYFGITIKTTANVLKSVDQKLTSPSQLINMNELKNNYDIFVEDYRKVKFGKQSNTKRVANEMPTGVMSSFDACINYVEKRILKKIEDLKKETVLLDQADKVVEPSAYDLLTCLTKYDPGTFENFCGDYGYDTDSRKAEKTYHEVVKEWNDLRSMFTETELQQLAEIS